MLIIHRWLGHFRVRRLACDPFFYSLGSYHALEGYETTASRSYQFINCPWIKRRLRLLQSAFQYARFSSRIALTHTTEKWALVDLARHPEKQNRLRRELLQFSGNDPTWDEVVTGNACPYLDAVVHESLRLHPPVQALQRIVCFLFMI